MFLFLERRNIMSRKKLVSICVFVVLFAVTCGIAEANWSDDFNDMTFDQTWQWYCIQDVTKTFTHTIQDGPGSNDFLVLSEPLSVDANGSAFGMGIGSQEEFTDVRLGAVLNADGQASSSKQSIYAISGRTQYFNHPGGGGVLPYPGVYASGYSLLMSWENAPARLEIEVQKYICLSNIMNTGFFTVQIPGADPDKSYYAVLDIVGSGPVYVTGSLYEFKGGPLVARIPTLIDTNLRDWWEDADDTDTFWIDDVKVFPITNFMDKNYRKSGVGGLNEDSTPPGYRVTFDDVSSISNGPAAVNPYPADGATGVPIINTVLSWKEAIFATSRDLWLGKAGKMQKVTPSPAGKTYDPGTLELGKTYQWQVDEIGPPTVTGYLWSFTTIPCLVVDDFEKYTNSEPNIIYKTWKDGLGYSPGNGTGSKAGYRDPDYAEVTIVHEGKQSLPVDYNNAKLPYYSEVDRTFDTPQDWTVYGVKALTLWLRGYPSVPPGTFVESPPTCTMTASGTDIGDVPDVRKPSKFHDEFHYACMQVSGDYAIAVKVESITNTDAWAKAGIMIRDSADANSAHVMTCLTPSTVNGIAFQNRAVAGGPSTNSINIPYINPPCWISLTRQGTSFAAGYSTNGSDWTHLSDVTVTMADPVCIGLSLTSHNASATCTAVFSNVALYNIVDNVYIPVTPSWTSRDIGIKSNVAAPLYVTLRDSAQKAATVTYKDYNNNVDPNIVLTTTWQPLDIALKDFADVNDVNLAAIKKITIGIGNRSAPQQGGIGTIYVDDIRLYPTRCIPDRIKGDLNNDCFPDYTDLDILADNWLMPSGLNSGLKGEYYTYLVAGNPPPNPWETLVLTRTDLTVDFEWGDFSPDPLITNDNFAVRWTGTVIPRYSETYTFTTRTDDGGRLYVNNQLVVDAFYDQGPTDHSGTISLQAETPYPIRMEYYERGGGAVAHLSWQSASQALQIIPSDRLSASKAKIADINNDGTVDFRDYAFLADKWLEEVLWP
jgi:regulation of enolase protein 1 (concanavalin A-like superfamily)